MDCSWSLRIEPAWRPNWTLTTELAVIESVITSTVDDHGSVEASAGTTVLGSSMARGNLVRPRLLVLVWVLARIVSARRGGGRPRALQQTGPGQCARAPAARADPRSAVPLPAASQSRARARADPLQDGGRNRRDDGRAQRAAGGHHRGDRGCAGARSPRPDPPITAGTRTHPAPPPTPSAAARTATGTGGAAASAVSPADNTAAAASSSGGAALSRLGAGGPVTVPASNEPARATAGTAVAAAGPASSSRPTGSASAPSAVVAAQRHSGGRERGRERRRSVHDTALARSRTRPSVTSPSMPRVPYGGMSVNPAAR